MPEHPCPVCGRPRRRGPDRNLLKTCGRPACVAARQGQAAGRMLARSNFRLGPGGHECHEEADGSWTHYLCGGPEGDHECVRHAGYHGDFCTEVSCDRRVEWIDGDPRCSLHRRSAEWLPPNAVPCSTPDDPRCRSLGPRHGHPRLVKK